MSNIDERVPAKGCNGPYEINRKGEIFNAKTGRKLKLSLNREDGYLFFWDYDGHGVKKMRCVAIMSALTYHPNPDNKPTVNHINGIKTDNRPENLEWMTRDEQMAHARDVLGVVFCKKGRPRPEGSGKPPRPVRGTHLKTGEPREFESIGEAARQVGGTIGNIWSACQGERKSAYGYRWEYIDKGLL